MYNNTVEQVHKKLDSSKLYRIRLMELPIKKLEQETECSICTENIYKDDSVYSLCHMFHVRCFTLWVLGDDANHLCPCCRNDVFS